MSLPDCPRSLECFKAPVFIDASTRVPPMLGSHDLPDAGIDINSVDARRMIQSVVREIVCTYSGCDMSHARSPAHHIALLRAV